ncbi:MAG: ParB/RepB/Spo0J family partition protein [Desulfovibrio sp.]|nr:ParB/RepB/Spo0J family partition protein [Desulfovibrio sp.]
MALNHRGLGRGIQALFESGTEIGQQAPGGEPSPLKSVPLDTIIPNPDQPRKSFDSASLQELADSIANHGILQPLLVRPGASEGMWQLLAGERRLRAAKLAGLREAPVLVRELSDTEALIVTLLENLQREDLNAIDEALGLNALKEAMNASVEELAATLGQPRSTISNSLRLLTLPEQVQNDVIEKRLTASHAKALAGIGSTDAVMELRNRILAENLTTRQTLDAAAFWSEHGRFVWQRENAQPQNQAGKRQAAAPSPELQKLGSALASNLQCRAKISGNENKGKISLSYDSSEQLQALLARLGIAESTNDA